MTKRKSHSMEFKRVVLSYVFENENRPKTAYAAEKNFKARGHIVQRQTIHGWMAQREEIMGSLNRGKRLDGEDEKLYLVLKLKILLSDSLRQKGLMAIV